MTTTSPEAKIVSEITLQWGEESRHDIIAAARSEQIWKRVAVFFFCALGLSISALISTGFAAYARDFSFSTEKYLLLYTAQYLGSGATLLAPSKNCVSLPFAFLVAGILQITCGFTLEYYAVLICIRSVIGYMQCYIISLFLVLASEWFHFDCTTIVITLLNAIMNCSFPVALAMRSNGVCIEYFFISSGGLCAVFSIACLVMDRLDFRFTVDINETIDSVVTETKTETKPKFGVSFGTSLLSFLAFLTYPLILWIGQIAIVMFDGIETTIAQKEYLRLMLAPILGYLMDKCKRNAFIFGFANICMSILFILLMLNIVPMEALILSGVFETMMLSSLYSIPVDLKKNTDVVLFQMNAWAYIGCAVVFLAFVHWGMRVIVASYAMCAITAVILAIYVPESNKTAGKKTTERQKSVNLYEMVKVASPIRNPGSPLKQKVNIRI